ncbi:RNA polymerase sigma factor SigI [Alicyclobacillus macrosporangiidus]|uniref:RNA polymerase sigma factor SigI n=1 Tax=Alicyclobacillus macrosporangiidus TaxID=392015 RepID=A0A1I7J0J2_9BACL|nr:RNA polymerase sigma factor SigI [Alicyclobacillus macrosporangiidus]SFU78690.1 RNA polymerase sigma factor [Alicyclobacillus macrosporangiidus]
MRGLLFGRKSEDKSQLDSLLALAQAGDADARNAIIAQYTPFILKVASQAARRYIDRERDDEYSVALMAMNEAIDRFDPARKVNFLGFAETIIRRRLIDHFRAQRAQAKAVPWTEFDVTDEEDNVVNYVEVKTSVEAHGEAEERAERQAEILEYARALSDYGLSFAELVEVSPKHADARANAIAVAKAVVADEELLRYVQERKSLPLKLLEERVQVSRKTMERQRKYILAVVVLLNGDFHHLRSYIS